jgi:hypothetical protein
MQQWPTSEVTSFDWSTGAVVSSSAIDDTVNDPQLLCRLRLDLAPKAGAAAPSQQDAALRPAAGHLPSALSAQGGVVVAELTPAELDDLIAVLATANAQIS